jgi:hypothetical protein
MTIATKDTQQNATLTLGTDSLSLRVVSITPITETIVDIPTTYLANTTKKTWMPGELADYPAFTVVYQNSPSLANPTKVVQTVTVTGPTASGAGTPESVTGTAFANSVTILPGYDSGTEGLQLKTVTIKWDGETGPTRTVSS